MMNLRNSIGTDTPAVMGTVGAKILSLVLIEYVILGNNINYRQRCSLFKGSYVNDCLESDRAARDIATLVS